MRVCFWGTRGSVPTPGPGTNRFGGNTSCVELTTSTGDLLIFDCGTGVRLLGADWMARASTPIRATILLSHTHWDHIQGFPFFAPLFVPGNEFAVFGPEGSRRSLHDVLAGQMEFTYFPVDLRQLPAALTYHDLPEGTREIGSMRIVAQYLHHTGVTLGYRVEADGAAVVYLTDHEPFADTLWRGDAEPGRIESILHDGDRRHARFMSGADLVIHDAQYTAEEYPAKRNWGHSTHDYAVELATAAGARRLALTHHDPAHDDAFVAAMERGARDLARQRGSALEVFSAYEGCDLTFHPDDARQPHPFPAGARPVERPVHGLRILVVDDDPDLRLLATRALQQDGHTVIEASNGGDALQMASRERPDLVVLDLVMPDPNGIEVLKRLRSNPETAHVPVLILTGLGDEESTRAGFEVGATDYLTKPFKIPQLTARVRACLARAVRRHGAG